MNIDSRSNYKKVVMIGPSLKSKGGIASVVCAYRDAGLFQSWPVLYLNSHVEGSKAQKAITVIVALATFIKMLVLGQVKLLHIHVPRRTAFWRKSLFIGLAYIFRCPVLVHLHSGGFPDFYWKECGTLKQRIVRFILNRADRIIVLSSQWWDLLEGITANTRLVKIPNFMDVNNLPVKSLPDRNSVLFLGRLNKEKGFFDLLEVVASIRKKFPGVKLICGGEGDRREVGDCINRLEIFDNVELLGWVEGAEKEALFQKATIFILPSYYEGLPMVVIEAMSRLIPVIATNVGGVPDIIENGRNGIMVEVGDVSAMAGAIESLLDNEAQRIKIAEAGRNTVFECFSAQHTLPKLERLYEEFGVKPFLLSNRLVTSH